MTSPPPSPTVPSPDTGSAGDVAAALSGVRGRIAAAAAAAGRPAGAVALVAVSKTHPAAAVAAAWAAGQALFGENRVQEAVAKFGPDAAVPAGLRAGRPGLRLHLIGALQTNKALEAVRAADVIESLDRPRLAAALAAAMARAGRRPDVLVQVNVGDEPQKAGVARGEADAFIESCRSEHGLPVRGLMAIPPAGQDPSPHFAWLAACAARHGLAVLSMGMSGDFEAAVAHGATHVRLGGAVFGARPAPA